MKYPRSFVLHALGFLLVMLFLLPESADSKLRQIKENIFPVGRLKPVDSMLKVKVGDPAPDFKLPALHEPPIQLHRFKGKKNVVISFIPAAWTPVCSDQWPGYHLAREIFEENEAVLLGITVDNIPTLFAWTRQMAVQGEKLWFSVLSDFWPHGGVAQRYGVLRSDGTAERALFVIDKEGVIRYIDVHDINNRPPLEDLVKALEDLKRYQKLR